MGNSKPTPSLRGMQAYALLHEAKVDWSRPGSTARAVGLLTAAFPISRASVYRLAAEVRATFEQFSKPAFSRSATATEGDTHVQ